MRILGGLVAALDLVVRALTLGRVRIAIRGDEDEGDAEHAEALLVQHQYAVAAFEEGRLDEAESRWNSILDDCDFEPVRAVAHGRLGVLYQLQGRMDKSVEHLREALEIDERTGDENARGSHLNSLAGVFIALNHLEMAEETCRESLRLARRSRDGGLIASALGNLGAVFLKRGSLDEAEKHVREALELERKMGDREGEASSLGNLGSILLMRGRTDEAEATYLEALAIQREEGDLEKAANQLGNLGTLRAKRGDLPGAIGHWHEARALFAKLGADHKVRGTDQLIQEAERGRTDW